MQPPAAIGACGRNSAKQYKCLFVLGTQPDKSVYLTFNNISQPQRISFEKFRLETHVICTVETCIQEPKL